MCLEATLELCEISDVLKRDCPSKCQLCRCKDENLDDCLNVTIDFCNRYPAIKQHCPKKCRLCGILLTIILDYIFPVSYNYSKYKIS